MIHDEKGRHYAVWDSIEDYCDNARERVLSNAPLISSGDINAGTQLALDNTRSLALSQ